VEGTYTVQRGENVKRKRLVTLCVLLALTAALVLTGCASGGSAVPFPVAAPALDETPECRSSGAELELTHLLQQPYYPQ